MREILFRGKCKTDNEWLYGFPYVTRKNAVKINWYCSEFGSMRTDEVDPETVGQYTGLTDKNGVRIFEGDIVHCVSKLDSADMVIIFECGQFRMILAEKYHEYQTNVGYYDINCFAKEVIGNIHDNPKLLTEGERVW